MVEEYMHVEYICLHGYIRDILSTQKCMRNTSWEQTGVPDQWKRMYKTMQNSVGWGNRGKTGVSKTRPALGRWGNWSRDPIPTLGQLSESEEETFKAESETADLWQPKWNENQTDLATAICTLDRDAGSLEQAVVGSCSIGIVEQSQCEGCCWLWRGLLITSYQRF